MAIYMMANCKRLTLEFEVFKSDAKCQHIATYISPLLGVVSGQLPAPVVGRRFRAIPVAFKAIHTQPFARSIFTHPAIRPGRPN